MEKWKVHEVWHKIGLGLDLSSATIYLCELGKLTSLNFIFSKIYFSRLL